MIPPLEVAGMGAVTPVGLTARQTCAAIRAGLSGFGMAPLPGAIGEERTVARVPAHWSLRDDPGRWLAHLAARALREALGPDEDDPKGPARALFLVPPERARGHPGLSGVAPEALLAGISAATGRRFGPASRVIDDGGAAAALGALRFAAEALGRGEAPEVVLLAVDSLLNPADLTRLLAANRLLGPENAQGLVPGEGAVALRLRPRGATGPGATVVLGVATTREPDTVEGARYSQGRALQEAFRGALGGQGELEPQVEFLVSNANGERYVQWEAMLARMRSFRTRRDRLPAVLPAMSVGDLGAASGALGLLLLHDAFRRGHAPGRVAACEATSEGGLRSAALVARAE